MIPKLKIKNFKLKIPAKWAGFTLIELLVVMTIATILMTALVVQQNSWGDQLSVNIQAYELALMIRQAQIYSLAVKADLSNPGDKFETRYGIQFDIDLNSQYRFFSDRNADLKWTSSSETIETKNLTKGVVVDKFCSINGVGNETCSTNPPTGNYRRLSISFHRPDTKAIIRFLNNGANGGNTFGAPVDKARIYLKSPNNKISSVTIEDNGQISIDQ